MTWAASLAFFVVCGLMFTGVLEPLTHGRDDSWAILVTPVAATFGLALAVRGWRMLFAPLALAFAAVVAAGDDPLAMAGIALAGLPALLIVGAIGVVVARRLQRAAGRAVLAAFAVAVLPLLWGTIDTVRRNTAAELPGKTVEQLPIDESFGNLCPEASTPPRISRRLRREAEVLLRELREHPHSLIPYTYVYGEEPPEKELITVRELAEQQLHGLRAGGDDRAPDLQRRLRDAL